MAKRVIILVLVALIALMSAPLCFAQPRGSIISEGKTTFGSVEATGLSQGAPGYLLLTDTDGDRFYLWVDTNGLLRIASEDEVTPRFETPIPSTAAWEDASGPAVGQQVAP